jgi:hypothetical protein
MVRIIDIAGHAQPREFRLVAACCRRPMDAEATAALRSVAAEAIDWRAVLTIVQRQRVGGLVQDALAAAGIDVPPPVAAQLAGHAQHIARRNLAVAAETARLQRAFDAAAIPLMLLKGVALAQLAYGSFTFKHNRDIDLYVPPESALKAMQRLEAEGYALSAPMADLDEAQRRMLVAYAREVELVHRVSRQCLELQWQFADNPLLLKGIGAEPPTQDVALFAGAAVRTLAKDDLVAYLCVHGASHSWSRLKWLADLNALLANESDAALVRLYRHAQARGAGLCAGQALLLCRDLLSRQLPPALNDELMKKARVRRLARLAWHAMTDAGADGGMSFAGKARFFFTSFLLGEGSVYVAAQCRIVSVGLADVIRYPLPRPWHFLYWVLRLPSWIWRYARALAARQPSPKRPSKL